MAGKVKVLVSFDEDDLGAFTFRQGLLGVEPGCIVDQEVAIRDHQR